jgi:hypothetical protein
MCGGLNVTKERVDENLYENDELPSGERREIEGERHDEVVDNVAKRHPKAKREDVDKALRAAKKRRSKKVKIPISKN